VADRKDDAAPPGLKFILDWDATNMPRRTALETAAAKYSLGWTNGAKGVSILLQNDQNHHVWTFDSSAKSADSFS
jgi:hypothetical protein